MISLFKLLCKKNNNIIVVVVVVVTIITSASGRAISCQRSLIWLYSSRSSAQQGRENTPDQSSIEE